MSQAFKLIRDIVVMSGSYHVSQPNHTYDLWFFSSTVLVVEPLFVATVVFALLTLVTALLYYKRVREASKAYETARSTVQDIVISFDKQMSRQEDQVGAALQRIDVQTAKNERLSKRVEEHESRIENLVNLNSKVDKVQDIDSVKNTLAGLQEKVEGLAKAQEEWKKRATPMIESQIEAAIPLRRDQALAPLTATELSVLEFIATSPSGERTAPEVKEMIKLTREHTARLMKKLYEGGYLERRAEKTPFAYRVKEEMLKLLKRSEANTQ